MTTVSTPSDIPRNMSAIIYNPYLDLCSALYRFLKGTRHGCDALEMRRELWVRGKGVCY